MVAQLAAERIGKLNSLEDELEQEREKLSAFQDIGLALGSSIDLDDVLSMVLARISKVVDAERAAIYVLDEETGELWSKINSPDGTQEVRLGFGKGIAGWVAQAGKALRIPDVYHDERFDPQLDQLTNYRTKSMLCVPMRNHLGRTLGVVQAHNKRNGSFDDSDEHFLMALASQAAVAIENSKLFLSLVGKNMELLDTKEQLETRVRELDVLFEIARLSAHSNRSDELLEGVLEHTMRALQAEAATILIVDEIGKGDLRIMTRTSGSKTVRRLVIPVSEQPKQWLEQYREVCVVNTLGDEAEPKALSPVADKAGIRLSSALKVPLRWEGGAGLLEVFNKGRGSGHFGEDDIRFAMTIAGQLSSAIALATARTQAQRQDRLSTIGQLLSSVLHDVRTPMAVVSGYIQMMMDEQDEVKRHQYGQKMLRQIDFINSMARETLAFAKGDRGIWLRKVYLNTFFEDLIEQLRKGVQGRSVNLELELLDRGIFYFDQLKIQRAIYNLVRNAWEAIGKRGGTIVVRVERREGDGALVISVRDDGPGLVDEVRERLFESFTTYGKEGGSGLGLAIVKKIVEDHHGHIEVESRSGFTEFKLILPQEKKDLSPRLTPPLGTLRDAVSSPTSGENK